MTLFDGSLIVAATTAAAIGAGAIAAHYRRAYRSLLSERKGASGGMAEKSSTSRSALENALFRSIVDLTEDPAVIVLDQAAGGVVVYANAAACRQLGLSLEEMLGCTPDKWCPHASVAVLNDFCRQLQRDKTLIFETEHRHSSDRLIPVEVTLNLIEHEGRFYVASYAHDISARKAAEAQVRSLNARLSATLEAVPDLLFETDRMGTYLNVWANNPALLSAPKLIGRRIAEVLPPAAAEAAMAALGDADLHGRVYGRLIPMEIDGETRWFEHSIAKRTEPDDANARFIVVSRDVTDRKANEAIIRGLNAHLSATLQAVPDLLFEVTRDGRYAGIWAKNHSLLVSPKEALLGHKVSEHLPPEAAQAVAEAIEEADRTGVSYGRTICLDVPAGRRWFELSISRKAAEDAGDCFIVLSRDITERRRMEEDLRLREQELRTLADHSPDVIVRYDRECRRVYVNAAYHAVRSESAHSVLGGTPLESDALSVDEGRQLYDAVAGVIASGEPADLELSWQRPDGSAVVYELRLVPEFDDANQVASALMVARDISHLKETERRLLESRALLQEFSARCEEAREDERKRIARDLHEELGQLLTVLRMNISTLSMQFGGKVPALQDRSKIMLALMDQTIEGVRDVVRALRPTPLDAGLVAGLKWLVDEFQGYTGAECTLEVPAEGMGSFADSHATALFRIVQECLTNVARHAGACHVAVVLDRVGDDWELTVRDNGCGFDPAIRRDKSFGLLGVRERALLLGGELHVQSAPGEGTSIRVRFSPNAAVLQ